MLVHIDSVKTYWQGVSVCTRRHVYSLFFCFHSFAHDNSLSFTPPFLSFWSGAPFGHAPGRVDITAKQVIFPTITQSSAASDAIYKKSHGTLGVAEQRSRGYDWEKNNIKPDSYVFGSKPQNIAFNGVSKSIADVLTTTEEDRGPVVISRAVSSTFFVFSHVAHDICYVRPCFDILYHLNLNSECCVSNFL